MLSLIGMLRVIFIDLKIGKRKTLKKTHTLRTNLANTYENLGYFFVCLYGCYH